MLAVFRAFAKSWAARGLILLIIVAFGLFGVGNYVRGVHQADYVVTAGDRKITEADFRRDFDNFKRTAQERSGQQVTAELAAENGLDKRLLEQVATKEGALAFLHSIGLRPSDKLVAKELQQIPAFFSSVTGQFDKQQYTDRLREVGLTPPGFDRELRDQIAQVHLAAAMESGLVVPRAYAALAAVYGMESRNVGFFPVPPNSVPPVTEPTDAELMQFMKENEAILKRPESRVITLARFSPSLVKADLKIDAAELQKRYEFRKDTLSKPELRSLVQIPAKDAAVAAQIVARLGKGEPPAAIAKSLGVDVIDYVDKPKTAIADRAVGDAAFKLAEGQVSAPIKGELGMAVVRVSKITPGVTPSLEQLRAELEGELRKDAAAEKVYAMTQAYDDAHAAGANLTEAATKAGAVVETLPALTKEGATLDGQPRGVPPRILAAAFNLPAGGESDVEDMGEGEYFAIRVEKILPPSLPPLAEARPMLAQNWIGREMMKRLQARAEALADRLRKGETLEAVASSGGVTVTRAIGLDRVRASQSKSLPREFAGKAFATKPGEVFVVEDATLGLVVGKVESVSVQPTPAMAMMTQAARPQLSQAVMQELMDSLSRSARAKMKVKTSYALARAAIGLEPLEEPKKDKKK